MANKLILIIIFIFGSYVYAQQYEISATQSDLSSMRADTTFQDGRRRKGKNIGNKPMPQYRVINKIYVTRSSFQKVGPGNEVRIKIMQFGSDNTDIEDFSLAYERGNEYHSSNVYGIENITFPFYVKVAYRSWNAFHAVQFDVRFEFTIYDPGVWNVTIFN